MEVNMISFSVINWIAVLLGTVLSMALGALWYGPLFGKLWLRLIDKTEDELDSSPLMYVKTALAAFITMLVLNMAVVAFGATDFLAGLLVGGFLFLGFGATATFVYTSFEGPSEKVWLLYAEYQLLVYLIMGVVFAIW
jgi:hypothetical protein